MVFFEIFYRQNLFSFFYNRKNLFMEEKLNKKET